MPGVRLHKLRYYSVGGYDQKDTNCPYGYASGENKITCNAEPKMKANQNQECVRASRLEELETIIEEGEIERGSPNNAD